MIRPAADEATEVVPAVSPTLQLRVERPGHTKVEDLRLRHTVGPFRDQDVARLEVPMARTSRPPRRCLGNSLITPFVLVRSNGSRSLTLRR